MSDKSEYPVLHGAQHLPTGSDPLLGQHALNVIIDGIGNPIATGIKTDILIERAHQITAWTLLADVDADVVIDIWKAAQADFPPDVTGTITGGNEPTLVGQSYARDDVLTGWTQQIDAGDVLRVNVDSSSAATLLTLILTLSPT